VSRGRSPTLRQSLTYAPVELAFGTSGLRGLVSDITDLEAYAAVRGFLDFLGSIGELRAGGPVCLGGDLRPSTEAILGAAFRAVTDAGASPVHFGRVPSPALLLSAMKRGAPGIMVTGSHIPFDRNGIKLTKKAGEVLKDDEKPIQDAIKAVREREYSRPIAESPFDERGSLRPEHGALLPAASADAADEYVRRYTSAFPQGSLTGIRVLVYQHSSVSRDILVHVLEELGARVVPAGRSDEFVAVDTEAVDARMISAIQALVDANSGASIDAVVSTDGDGDRPLVLGVESGRVRFFPGDLLGIVTADFLRAREIAVPISVSDAVDAHFAPRGIRPVKTRIGSPWVIAAMRQVGWEANGGFLTAEPLAVPGGGILEALPSRDAFLPILAVLCAGPGSGVRLGDLFFRLPPRFGRSALVRPFPRDRAQALIRAFSPRDGSVTDARQPFGREVAMIRDSIERCFAKRDGFGPVSWINWLDGVRIGFENGDIVHIRASGNAPELRIYAVADTEDRAELIAGSAVSPEGIVSRLEAETVQMDAVGSFKASPGPIFLEGAVQAYPWGGLTYIPALLGRDNPRGLPHAELWFGAHPLAPSRAVIGDARIGLDRLVAAAGGEILGADAERFGGRLPFLLKVLDAREMLSIQAHPSRQQAAAGYARENAAGIPFDAPRRTYRDDNHKPEVHACLSEFWMLHGFRPLEEIEAILEGSFELGRLMPGFSAPSQPGARPEALRALYTRVMTMPQTEVDATLGPLVARLERRERDDGLDKDTADFWALRAARDMPLPGGSVDRGIFSIYLMNLLHLHPGQGTYQPAGVLHAYLEGTNVELMANSDNVLRGGLTTKTVDTEELLRVVTFTDGHPPVLAARMKGEGVSFYETPSEEFVLERIDLAEGRPVTENAAHGAQCLLVIEGAGALISKGRTMDLNRGSAVLVPAGTPYRLQTASGALAFRAAIPAVAPAAVP